MKGKGQGGARRLVLQFAAAVFWIGLWQVVSMRGTLGIFIASPWQTVQRFFELCLTLPFWKALLYTTGRILTGFFLAVTAGTVLSALTAGFYWLDIFLMPVMRLIRTVPVVSFVILALIMVSSRYLTQLISFLMALPVVYMNVKNGISQMDPGLKEMAGVFRVTLWRKIWFMYVPQVMSAFETGTALALGFAWKSGLAAEVIGIPSGSVGERLQQAKVYLNTPDLFAWTLAVVFVSVLLEKGWRWLLHCFGNPAPARNRQKREKKR